MKGPKDNNKIYNCAKNVIKYTNGLQFLNDRVHAKHKIKLTWPLQKNHRGYSLGYSLAVLRTLCNRICCY